MVMVAVLVLSLLGLLIAGLPIRSYRDLLKADNVVSGTLPGFRELNIQPKTVEEVVPTYIGPRASGPHLSVFRDR